MINDRKFEIVEDKRHYKLPEYRVTAEGLKEVGAQSICFVRGTKHQLITEKEYFRAKADLALYEESLKNGNEVLMNFEERPNYLGILHEGLLSMMIHDLEEKKYELYSPETNEAIKCL